MSDGVYWHAHAHDVLARPALSLDSVLHVLDGRDGSFAAIVPRRPGVLRVCAHEPGGASGAGTGLRVLLVADLLARTAELSGLQAFTAVAGVGRAIPLALAPGQIDAEALGFRQPAVYARCEQVRSVLGGPADLHVAGPDGGSGTDGDGITIQVGPVNDISADGGDAASAVRLALMGFPYHQPADLTSSVLASAAGTLRCWRHRVAEWGESPSRPIPPHILAAVRGAFSRLDTVSALALLHELVSDRGLSAGARFEAFVYADRVLGLELARQIGQPRG